MNTESQYRFKKIEITSERWGDVQIDISGSVVELNIYEHIEKPYLTGNLLFVDSHQFKSYKGITGTERVSIEINTAAKETITKKFIITSVTKEVSANERTDVRLLQLVEEHAFLSSIKKFSKSYRGPSSKIIGSILAGHLGKEINVSRVGGEKEIRVVIPYLTPLDACEWIRDGMTTAGGSPYFLHASMNNDNVSLVALDKLLEKDSWNEDLPYTYGLPAHSVEGEVRPGSQLQRDLFKIQNIQATNMENTLQLAMGGAVGAEINTLDVTIGEQNYSGQVTSKDTIKRLLSKVKTDPGASALNYFAEMELGVDNLPYKTLEQHPSRVFATITADVYDDVDSYNHERHDARARYRNKLKAAQLKRVLLNNAYDVQVAGVPFAAIEEAGVGSNIDIQYAVSTVDTPNMRDIDPERSGKFMIYKARHQFAAGKYTVSMSVVKLTRTV